MNAFTQIFRTRRRKKIVDFFAQLQIAVEILMHVVIFVMLTLITLYMDPIATWFSKYSIETHKDAISTLLEINLQKWPLFILILVLVVFFSVLFSHKVVGAAYKLNLMLTKYAERDLREKTVLRKHDYLFNLVPVLNRFKSTVNQDLLEIKKELKKMSEIASALQEGHPKDELKKVIQSTTQKLERYSLHEVDQ